MGKALLSFVFLASCVGATAAAPPATVEPAPKPASFLRGGKSYTFDMWQPQRGDLIAHAPVRVDWITCTLHLGVDGALKKAFCVPAKPAPEELSSEIRSGLDHCYRVTHQAGAEDAVRAMERQYLPDAKEVISKERLTVLRQKTIREEEVSLYGIGGSESDVDRVPPCPKERPGCDYGMVPFRKKVLRVPIGTKIEKRESEEPAAFTDYGMLPNRYPPIQFQIAIPASGSEEKPIIDPRFDVETKGREGAAVADDLALRLDRIDPTREPGAVQEAYWLDRVLVAMLRRDVVALDAAFHGLEAISRGGAARSWAKGALYTLGQIRERKLVFDDPCR